MAIRASSVFDGHNDTLLSLRETGRSFFEESTEGHLDLPRAQKGGLAGGFFAVWIPDPSADARDPDSGDPTLGAYADPNAMPAPLELHYSEHYAMETLASAATLERESRGSVKICRTVDEIRTCLDTGVFAIELHIEGAEPIDPSLDTLEVFYLAGVRSIGLTWSRNNAFACGVPFQFPGSPDTGPGLTDAGKSLVRACNELGILVDVSHLNEAGFWDVVDISNAPIVATHSGVHAISPSTRNLTDKQLDAIRDSGGIVGVNYHVGFARPDGKADAETTTVVALADHVDYLVDRIGEEKVALGSDFDGATMPGDLRDAAGLPLLMSELSRRGYSDSALKSIGYENWLRGFALTWK